MPLADRLWHDQYTRKGTPVQSRPLPTGRFRRNVNTVFTKGTGRCPVQPPRMVKVLVFASLKDILGSGTCDVDVPPGARVDDVVRALCAAHPDLGPRVPFLRYAVNEMLVARDHRLQEGDEVALLPPTSGG